VVGPGVVTWRRLPGCVGLVSVDFAVVRGTVATFSPSMASWQPWSSAVTVTVLRAWIMPTWMRLGGDHDGAAQTVA
jgi:hypothetical protein